MKWHSPCVCMLWGGGWGRVGDDDDDGAGAVGAVGVGFSSFFMSVTMTTFFPENEWKRNVNANEPNRTKPSNKRINIKIIIIIMVDLVRASP